MRAALATGIVARSRCRNPRNPRGSRQNGNARASIWNADCAEPTNRCCRNRPSCGAITWCKRAPTEFRLGVELRGLARVASTYALHNEGERDIADRVSQERNPTGPCTWAVDHASSRQALRTLECDHEVPQATDGPGTVRSRVANRARIRLAFVRWS